MLEPSADSAQDPAGAPRRAAWAVAGVGAVLVAAYSLGLVLGRGDHFARLQSDLAYPLAPLFALVLMVFPISRSRGRRLMSWCALAAGVLAWLLGDLSYSYYDLRFGTTPPSPGITDAIYAAGYLGFALAFPLLAFPSWKVRDWRWVFDAALVLAVAVPVVWVHLLVPVATAGYSTPELVAAVAYPIADLTLLSILVVGWYANAGSMTRSVAILAAGIVAFVAADAGYTYLVSTAGYESAANPLDPVWMTAYVLIGIAALLEDGSEPAATRDKGASLLGITLPYAVVPVLAALTLVHHYVLGNDQLVLIGATVVAAVLVLLRQFGTLRENLRLLQRLEARTAELEESSRVLRATQERLTAVISKAPIVLFSIDREGIFTLSEGAGLKPLGLAAGEVVGRSVRDVYRDAPRIIANIERALQGEDVDEVVDLGGLSYATHYTPLRDESGAIIGVTGVATDVSERERFQRQLIHLANNDPLTGLINRRRMNEEIERALAEWREDGTESALLFLDLDQFKDVNDAYGHRTGDELLVQVSRVLLSLVRESDCVSRFGGDEFAILLRRTPPDRAEQIADTLVKRLAEREFSIDGIQIAASASVGIAGIGRDGTNASDLMARADAAMYRAKERGRNRAFTYRPSLDDAAEARSGWQHRIRQALSDGRFALHAQPIVDLQSLRVVEHELLLRMVERDGELTPPSTFLGFAERSGLIVEIDRWVVERALAMLEDATRQGLRLSVNVSGQSLTDHGLLSLLERHHAAGRLPPGMLTIEITETAAVEDLDAALAFTAAVRAFGCNVALDDFGVGFSSFAQLKRLDANLVKIDGTFVRNLATDGVDRQLVLSMTQLAHALGKRVIAEFVTDAESVEWLRSCGVDFAQGYHFGTPQPLALDAKLAA